MTRESAFPQRPISAVLTRQLLAYVRRVLGQDAADRVLADAGLADKVEELHDPSGWCEPGDVIALAAAAGRICNDPDIGRRIGESLHVSHDYSGITVFHRAAGSVPDAVALALDYGSRLGVGRRSSIEQVDERHLVIETNYADPNLDERFRLFCGISMGYFARLPSTFGVHGSATESACSLLGADRCVMHLVWSPERPMAPEVVERSVDAIGNGLSSYENLQQMAADLVTEQDIATLLDKVVHRTGTAALAPRTLLAVRLPGERQVRVHHVGFTDETAAAVADDVLEGTADPRWGHPLVVPVASPRYDYGKLAVFFSRDSPPASGGAVDAVLRRMLLAYAGHATAAIDAAVMLADARQHRETAEALLDMARSLTEVGDTEETARRLSVAVRALTGCDRAGVWTWDATTETATIRAWTPEELRHSGLNFRLGQVPELARMVTSPGPMSLTVEEASPQLAAALAKTGTTQVLAIPVAAGGALIGLVVASFSDTAERFDDALLRRLQGLADQGAAAFENSRLLEKVRHQALHDPLTNLPNRTLVQDRARQALARAARLSATVGLVFVDLDHFKDVNDSLGHAAGDELLRQVAERLQRCVRAADTVARLAGDEFLLVLPELPDQPAAFAAAHKIRQELSVPFEVDGRSVELSASVGISCAPTDGDDYDQLLLRADAAMYAAKEQGRNSVVTYSNAVGRHLDDEGELVRRPSGS